MQEEPQQLPTSTPPPPPPPLLPTTTTTTTPTTPTTTTETQSETTSLFDTIASTNSIIESPETTNTTTTILGGGGGGGRGEERERTEDSSIQNEKKEQIETSYSTKPASIIQESNTPLLALSSSSSNQRNFIPPDAICRICHGGHTPQTPLFFPCQCSGSMKYLHESCLAAWLQTSGKDHCEVCHFKFQYNIEFDSNAHHTKTIFEIISVLELLQYSTRALWYGMKKIIRCLFVMTLWSIVFLINAVMIYSFLPNMDFVTHLWNFHPHMNENTTSTNRTHQLELWEEHGYLNISSVVFGICIGCVVEIAFVIIFCFFSFHHQNRDGQFFFDLENIPNPNNNPLEEIRREEFERDQERILRRIDRRQRRRIRRERVPAQEQERDEDWERNIRNVDEQEGLVERNFIERINDMNLNLNPEAQGEDQREDMQNLNDNDEAADDERVDINNIRPIEVLGFGGRLSAFLWTISTIATCNIVLTTCFFYVPYWIGSLVLKKQLHISFAAHALSAFSQIRNWSSIWFDSNQLWNDPRNQEMFQSWMPQDMWLFGIELLRWTRETWSNFPNSSLGRLVEGLYSDVHRWIIGTPTAVGYVVIMIHLSILFVLDFGYYHWIRPQLVHRKKYQKQNISRFWCLIERLSRLLTPFWRIIDSLLRLIDCVIQLFAIPYLFGMCIEYATRSVRQVNFDYDESVMSLSLALKKLSVLQEQSLAASVNATRGATAKDPFSNLTMVKETLFRNPMDLIWFLLLDRSFLSKDAAMHREALRVIENELASRILVWMVGFWYVLMTMRTFQQARHLIRMEFNAYWMRFPQPHQIPISLSLFRAMKERIISMRIHVPVMLLGIYIPCKMMRYCFPSVFPLHLSSKDVRNIPLTVMFFVYGFAAFAIVKRLRLKEQWTQFAQKWLDIVSFGLNIRYLIVPGSDPPSEAMIDVQAIDAIVQHERIALRNLNHHNENALNENNENDNPLMEWVEEDEEEEEEVVEDEARVEEQHIESIDEKKDPLQEMATNEIINEYSQFDTELENNDEKNQFDSLENFDNTTTLDQIVEPKDTTTEYKYDNIQNQKEEENISLKNDIEHHLNESLLGTNEKESNEEPTDTFETQETQEANAQAPEAAPAPAAAAAERRQHKKKKKKKAVDDIFMTRHPWESPNDLYVQLQTERRKLTERCALYTVGVDHILLRIFIFVLLLWLTHILLFFAVTLVPIVSGRWVRSYFHFTNRSDIAAYFTGIMVCVQLPYEIYRLHRHYNGGQLWRKIKKGLIRIFLFLLLPLVFGYGWMIMVFHCTHPILETPSLPLAELYCTGIYITSVYLLLQDQEKIQETIRWIQGHMDIDLWRFWNEVAKNIVKVVIVHLSFPIALRYLLLHLVILPRQSEFQLSTLMIDINAIQGHGGQSPLNTTLPLSVRYNDPHLQNISFDYYRRWDERTPDEIDQVKKEINQSALTIDSIVKGEVSLHYNLHEYGLFLHRSPIKKLLRQVISGDLHSIYQWFEDSYNTKVWMKFMQFLCELLILRCPVIILLWLRFNYELTCVIVSKLPSIKEHILMQKYGANRKLVNYNVKNNNNNPVQPLNDEQNRNKNEDQNQDQNENANANANANENNRIGLLGENLQNVDAQRPEDLLF